MTRMRIGTVSMLLAAGLLAAGLLAAGLLAAGAFAQVKYDLLLKGGHVIDPKNNIDRAMDVAVMQGKIAAVAGEIPASSAA